MLRTERVPGVTGDFTIGRGGAKIPVPKAPERPLNGSSVLVFFHQLWKLNDRQPSGTYNLELVLPPDADKPLTVVRGNLKPLLSAEEIDGQLHRKMMRGGTYRVNTASERHAVLLPPANGKVGEFKETFGVGYQHHVGVSYGSVGDPVEVAIDGRVINPYDFMPDANDIPVEEKIRTRDGLYSQAIGQIIERTVEFLSES